jgi:hypothetical protein
MRSDRLVRSIGTALLAVVLAAHVRMAVRGGPPVAPTAAALAAILVLALNAPAVTADP